ncbi:hypothetical protein ACFWBR_35060 [Streptomyces sp. NPDC060006]|uniref:hypothetical protein n=1 Tax=unclassified Streptomyces TaxID=2593676 RepID=UPI0036A5224E
MSENTNPIVAVAPATGWNANFSPTRSRNKPLPIVAWCIRADGETFPIAMGLDGRGFNAAEAEGFAGIAPA